MYNLELEKLTNNLTNISFDDHKSSKHMISRLRYPRGDISKL